MSNPQTLCVWCGGKPVTKGHIWPEWFDKVLTLNAPEHRIAVEPPRPGVDGPPPYERIRQGHSGTRKPRNTCLECNRGWMSRLEQASIPSMSKLMRGVPHLLDSTDQFLIAAFLCLVTIRFEFTDTSLQAVPREHRDYLRLNGHPPEGWGIWIARYHGTKADEHWCRHWGIRAMLSPADKGLSDKCNTQVTTMVMGKLCAHIFSTTLRGAFSGYNGKHPVRIWPPTGLYIDTRTTPVLGDDEIVALHNGIADNLNPA